MFTVQVVDRKADHESELLKSKQRCEEIEAQLEDNSKKARSGFLNIYNIVFVSDFVWRMQLIIIQG